MKLKFVILIYLLFCQTAFTHELNWQEEPKMFNQTGLFIRDRNTQIEVVDLNEDGLYDIILNDYDGELRYFENTGEKGGFHWKEKAFVSPDILLLDTYYYYGYPLSFNLLDFPPNKQLEQPPITAYFLPGTRINGILCKGLTEVPVELRPVIIEKI